MSAQQMFTYFLSTSPCMCDNVCVCVRESEREEVREREWEKDREWERLGEICGMRMGFFLLYFVCRKWRNYEPHICFLINEDVWTRSTSGLNPTTLCFLLVLKLSMFNLMLVLFKNNTSLWVYNERKDQNVLNYELISEIFLQNWLKLEIVS